MAKKFGKINIDKLADVLREELQDYAYVADTVVNKAVEKTAKETSETLQGSSPVLTGDYAKSWTYGEKKQSKGKFQMTVYADAPEYRLTHLLEKGHAKVNGGRVAGIPHIQPAELSAAELLINHIKEGLE